MKRRPSVVWLALALLTSAAPPTLSAVYPTQPRWESGQANQTRAVAVGDIDLDGNLDVVCANLFQENTLYLGGNGAFAATPAWTSTGITAGTLSLALGDVDRDGDLDLVCGNTGTLGEDFLFLNEGGTFAASPEWSSGINDRTQSLALADLNGDGLLDLVCGNFAEPNRVYLGTGRAFSMTPSWESPLPDSTFGIALADLNLDGRLDLVCANFGANTVYLNTNGMLDTTAAWSSVPAVQSTDVVIADLDGNGNPDAVFANYDRPNAAYLDQGGLFASTPVWSSIPADSTWAVAMGDVDNDGDIDAVFVNSPNGTALYRNVGSLAVFETSPAWRAGSGNSSVGLAMADMNRDGKLDVVIANSGQNNAGYMNEDGPFAPTPDWLSGPANRTQAVALGDIDGDNDLDAVFANVGVNTMYENDGTGLGQTAAWSSIVSNKSTILALGDVSRNGFLDAVFGNGVAPGEPNTMYPNTNGVLATMPSWYSARDSITLGVVLGDIDGDGDLDLACGNAGTANAVYLGAGGAFETTPAWLSNPRRFTTGVALGDIDGDGDLDLVCGNSDQRNTAYRNQNGVLDPDPFWESLLQSTTGFIALGDVDGDGDLDLACANDGQANTVYRNDGGTFDVVPFWSSRPTYTSAAVAFGDVDGDGDLDLVFGNLLEGNTAYINVAGTFATEPTWLSADVREAEGIALGDIDGDGDLDLVCANEAQPNTAYLGEKNPPYIGLPSNPTNQMTNNAAFLSSVQVEQAAPNTRRVRFEVMDVESDPVWLVAEYQFEGDPQWLRADIVGAGGVAGRFTSSPDGTPDSLDWDITTVMFDRRPATLRLTAVEIPASVSIIRESPSYVRSLGTIAPQRPEISSPAGVVPFPTVTLGDTVWVDLDVSNRGNVDLIVSQVTLPSGEMESDLASPLIIAPATSGGIRVFLEPELEQSIGGYIELWSNDPLTPIDSVRITTDIRALAVKSRLLSPDAVLPLGEAATVIVEPFPAVVVESGSLFHRSVGEQTFAEVPLSPSGDDFVAVIPGASVTEAGLEYYVEVHNSSISNTDPPGAPLDSLYSRAVEQPVVVTALPTPTEDADFLEGRSITVRAVLPQGTGFVDGKLYAREAGTKPYGQIDLVFDGATPTAVIPDSIVGSHGVEYWVEVTTLTRTLTDPPADPAGRPASISIAVDNLVEPHAHPALQWRLFSIPLAMQGPILGSIADDLGGVDITQWRMFLYESATKSYVEVPNDTIDSFEKGRGYWLISRKRTQIGTGPDRGRTTPTDQPYEITLQHDYNLIANPFNFAVAWDSMMVDTLSMTQALGVVVEPPIGWSSGGGYEDSIAVLAPFDGYWVKSLSPSPVVLKIPPLEVSSTVPQPLAAAPSGNTWGVRIKASSVGARDAAAYLGVAPGAVTAHDRHDRSKPPMPPGDVVFVYFPHNSWEQHPDLYAHDIRGDYDELRSRAAQIAGFGSGAWGHEWRFDIAKNFAVDNVDALELEFTGIGSVPAEIDLYLVDRELDKAVDLRETPVYSFYQGEKALVPSDDDARFVVVAGDRRFVADALPTLPTVTRLHQNYPNPFNPTTVIRYEVARRSDVTLRIYDASGALVRELYRGTREPGVYEVLWNGSNAHGTAVASGVYFYRLVAGDIVDTRKMLLLK